MKLTRRKRTPKIKIDELDLRHFPVVGDPDPYWADLYNPSVKCQVKSVNHNHAKFC